LGFHFNVLIGVFSVWAESDQDEVLLSPRDEMAHYKPLNLSKVAEEHDAESKNDVDDLALEYEVRQSHANSLARKKAVSVSAALLSSPAFVWG
jgi:hypothetical protein